jgi:hypothetical protein
MKAEMGVRRMRGIRKISVVAALMTTILGFATAPPALAYMTHLRANLSGSSAYPNATGHADYWHCCRYREFEAGLSGIGSLSGTTLTVYAAGHKVGTMRVGSDGYCHLRRDTRNGQYVPALFSGDVVSVKKADGTLVASGVLKRRMMT